MQADATCLAERGERGMRGIRLLRGSSAQILYLIAHRRGKCCRHLVQHQPGTFRARVFRVCHNLSVAGVMELRSRAASICFPPCVRDSPRDECRRVSQLRNPFEFRRCCDAAFWHPACSGRERRHSFLRPGTQIGLRKKFGCAAYIAGSNSERSGIVRWNGTGNNSH
jgi:hypothetical protein